MTRKAKGKKTPPANEETPKQTQDLSIPATPETLAQAVTRGRKHPKALGA